MGEPKWVPINNFPGDQLYDDVPGTEDKSYWGTIGPEHDGRWGWSITGCDDSGDQWDEASGRVGDEATAKAMVETWTPTLVADHVPHP